MTTIRLYPENPDPRRIAQIISVLEEGGIIIYPTDGVYAFGCSPRSARGIERIKALKGKSSAKLTIVCHSLSQVSEYGRFDNTEFRIMKRNLPGAFTFILRASSKVPDKVLEKRKTVGVRIPANEIPLAIVRELGAPLITSSVRYDAPEPEYITDPELIAEQWGDSVDLIIDGGLGKLDPTTVVDLTGDEPQVVRQGGADLIL